MSDEDGAWDLVERSMVEATDHILIHGGVGGVGHVAVQLAKRMGARITTTVSSAEAAALAKSFGADETISFREETADAYTARLAGVRAIVVLPPRASASVSGRIRRDHPRGSSVEMLNH
jgi:NADPH:quinone reductase